MEYYIPMEKLEISKNIKQNIEIPSNIEAEQHLLGSVLVNNDIIDEIANIINAEKFYDPIHQISTKLSEGWCRVGQFTALVLSEETCNKWQLK